MEYYSAIKRNTFEAVLMRCMNLEPVIQREVIQKEKDKYHMIYGIQKDVLRTVCAGQQRRHRHKEQSFGFSGRRSRWDDLRE